MTIQKNFHKIAMSALFFLLAFFGFVQAKAQIHSGAEQIDQYVPMLRKGNTRVGLLCNQSSKVGYTPLLDTLLKRGVQITKIFTPEHGFRGTEEAGAHIADSTDEATGIPIFSLYGETRKPNSYHMQDLDYVVIDLQDVGVRFYTYISTLQYMLEACGLSGTRVIVLDRPNPNGHYIDGPVLQRGYESFLGMQQIPLVYGMTIGEYAQMITTEGWLANGVKPELTVIPCQNYDHTMKFSLNIPPSPNLKTEKSIALYPSICLFEGTNVSVGRGTDRPFEIFGSPYLNKDSFHFAFVPKPNFGAKKPPFSGETCYGEDLSDMPVPDRLDLSHLIKAYRSWNSTLFPFFSNNANHFNLLAGNKTLKLAIEKGYSEAAIRKSWQTDLLKFYLIRKTYLLYPDFPNPFK